MSNTPQMPSLLDVPKGVTPEMQNFLESVKELSETREGLRGDELDRFVSMRDLQTLNLNQMGFADDLITPFQDESVIAPPTNLTIEVGAWSNTLRWVNPEGNHLAGIEIWYHTSNVVTSATRIGITGPNTTTFIHETPIVTSDAYYWIRAITYAGNYSTWCPDVLQGGFLVPRKDSLGERIDKVIDALLGSDPPLYASGTVYQIDELVRWTDTDTNIKRYRRRNYNIGVSNHPPSETLYWERVGILAQGDVDGQPTVGIDGNLVVDQTILARAIQTSTLAVGDGSNGSIVIQDGVVEVRHMGSGSLEGMYRNSIDSNFVQDSNFARSVAGEDHWTLWGNVLPIFGLYGENNNPGIKLTQSNGLAHYSAANSFKYPAQKGEKIFVQGRAYLSSDYASSSTAGIQIQITELDKDGNPVAYPEVATGVATKGSWFNFGGSVTLTHASTQFIRPVIYIYHNNTTGAAGYASVDWIYISRAEYAPTNDSGFRNPIDITKIDGGKIYTGSIVGDSLAANIITATHVGTNEIIANTANLKDAVVSTLKIGTNAVTVPASAFTAAQISFGTTEAWIQSVSLNSAAFPVQVFFSGHVYAISNSDYNPTKYIILKIYRGSTLLLSRQVIIPGPQYEESPHFHITLMAFDQSPPTGTNTYAFQAVSASGGTYWVEDRSMFAIGVKR